MHITCMVIYTMGGFEGWVGEVSFNPLGDSCVA